MANRIFRQFANYLENGPAFLWFEVAVGAVGAPTLNSSKSKGITSVTRTGVGAYTVTLSDAYVDFLHLGATRTLAAGAPVAASLVARTVDVKSAKQITLAYVDGAGAAVELNSGTVLNFQLELKRSTV
jgi:hypothetical protein